MCLSVPYGSGDRPPGRWQLLRQLPGFLWMLAKMLTLGAWQRLVHP